MAEDSRQFVDHFEMSGSSVYVEDKRMGELKDATESTSIDTAADYIPLQDIDGNLIKIAPESLMEAVRNVFGTLLINNDKGTSITGLPAMSGSGSFIDFGSITPTNLASVLGVFQFLHLSGDAGVNMRDMPCPSITTFSGSRMTNGPQFDSDTMVIGFFFPGYGTEKAAILFGNTSHNIFVCTDYKNCTRESWQKIV